MKNKKFIIALAAAIVAFWPDSNACSDILVTKGATKDGTNMLTYSCDGFGGFGALGFIPAGDWAPGELMQLRGWGRGKSISIPQVPHTYQVMGHINEHQLIITESTFDGRLECMDSTAAVSYFSLIDIALQRARTAREAIQVIVDLTNAYGYSSSGESFSIADKDEVWIMDMIGKGCKIVDGENVNKGMVFVARRIPDGYISGHANHARISTFPLDDPENCIYAPDVISFAREMGFFDGKDEDFSFCDAYDPLDFSKMRSCDARVWSMFNTLCDGQFTFPDKDGNIVTRPASDYLDYATGHNPNNPLPLFVKPSRQLSVKDVADMMRDHYEGTPLDPTTNIGAGGNALPYRWKPSTYEYEGKTYTNERTIATQQTIYWLLAQSRPDLPDEIGALIWFGTDDAATSYLTPIYACTRECPECFRRGNGSMDTYSPTCSFWLNNRVANACYKMYNVMAPTVRAEIDKWENYQIEHIAEVDQEALAMYNAAQSNEQPGADDPYAELKDYLSKYSLDSAQEIFDKWTNLEISLLMRYFDGLDVQPRDERRPGGPGPGGPGGPGRMQFHGYTDKWKEAVVKDHGEFLEVVDYGSEQ